MLLSAAPRRFSIPSPRWNDSDDGCGRGIMAFNGPWDVRGAHACFADIWAAQGCERRIIQVDKKDLAPSITLWINHRCLRAALKAHCSMLSLLSGIVPMWMARCLRGMPLKVCSTTGTILVRRLWNSAEAFRKSKLCSSPPHKFENVSYPPAIRKLKNVQQNHPHRTNPTNIDSSPKYFQLSIHGCSCATMPLNFQILARTMMGGIITNHRLTGTIILWGEWERIPTAPTLTKDPSDPLDTNLTRGE